MIELIWELTPIKDAYKDLTAADRCVKKHRLNQNNKGLSHEESQCCDSGV